MKFDIWVFLKKKSVEKIQFSLKCDKNSRYFIRIPIYTCNNIWLNLLTVRNISDEICSRNQNTHFMFNKVFSENLGFVRYCGKNMVEPYRPQMTIWRMCISCWITTATDPHLEYVMSNVFFSISYAKAPQSYVISKSPAFTMKFLVIFQTFLNPVLLIWNLWCSISTLWLSVYQLLRCGRYIRRCVWPAYAVKGVLQCACWTTSQLDTTSEIIIHKDT